MECIEDKNCLRSLKMGREIRTEEEGRREAFSMSNVSDMVTIVSGTQSSTGSTYMAMWGGGDESMFLMEW